MSKKFTATTFVYFSGLNAAIKVEDLEERETAIKLISGDYGDAYCKAQVYALTKEAQGKSTLGTVKLVNFLSERKPIEMDSETEWTAFLAHMEARGFTKRSEVYKYLIKQGYYGISFSDDLAYKLCQSAQPSMVRCTRPYGHVMFFGQPNDFGGFDVCADITKPTRKAYGRYLERADKIKLKSSKKEQHQIKQVTMQDISFNPATGKCGVLPEKEVKEVGTSTSVMFEMAKAEGIDILVLDMTGNLDSIENSDSSRKDKERYRQFALTSIIWNGIWVNGKVYYPLLQSASQSRTGKIYMAAATVDQIEAFRDKLSYGAFIAKKGKATNMAKLEARFSLASTNSISVGFHEVNYGFIQKDVELAVCYKAKGVKELRDSAGEVTGYVIEDRTVTNNNATDGASWVHPRKAAEFAYMLGNISKMDFNYFDKHYVSLKREDIESDPRLARIFAKIPKVFQVRCESIKGLLVMYDFTQECDGIFADQMFVLHESMVKASKSNGLEKAEWRIANVNNKKWGKVTLSTQFMTVLGMNLDDVATLVANTLSKIDTEILKDPDAALKFVNAVSTVDGEKDTLDTKLAVALASNPAFIKERWVRKQLRKLVDKTVTKLKYGGVIVDGIYAYAIPDPRCFFRAEFDEKGKFKSCKDCLQVGEYYLNNMKGEVAFLRAPHIHHTESQVLTLVEDNELWYLDNVVVFNPFDPTAQACQGMDFDGDQGLITTCIEIIRNIKKEKPFMIEQGIGAKAEEVIFNTENRLRLYLRRSSKDNVGILSNYALLFREYQNHLMNLTGDNQDLINELEEKVIILACLIGAEIDYAKTGVRPTITDDLKAKVFPAWWVEFKYDMKKEYGALPKAEAMEKIRAKLIKTNGEDCIYGDNFTCLSPVGVCHKLVTEWQEANQNDFEGEAGSANLARLIPSLIGMDRITLELLADAESLGKSYGRELKKLAETVFEDEDTRKEVFADFYARYEAAFNSLSEDRVAVAAATYYVLNKDEGKGNSAPWTCCFDGLIALFSEESNTMLYNLPSYVKEGDSVEVDNHALFINRRYAGESTLPAGIYPVIMIQGRSYTKVTLKGSLKVKPQVDANGEEVKGAYVDETIFKLTAKGFRHHDMTASLFVKYLEDSLFETEVRVGTDNQLYVYNGEKTLALATTSYVGLTAMRNARIQIVDRNIATTYVNKDNKVVESGVLDLLVRIVGTTEETLVVPQGADRSFAANSLAVDAYDIYDAPTADELAYEMSNATYEPEYACSYVDVNDLV